MLIGLGIIWLKDIESLSSFTLPGKLAENETLFKGVSLYQKILLTKTTLLPKWKFCSELKLRRGMFSDSDEKDKKGFASTVDHFLRKST